MSGDFLFFAEGLKNLEAFTREMGEGVSVKASMAINDALSFARTRASQVMLREVAWPSSYLSPAGGRLAVSKYATPGSLEGAIKGRDRPTSLATFVRSGTGKKGSPISVSVNSGGAPTVLKRAFLIHLRQGNSGALGNLGLAWRSKGNDDRPPPSAWRPVRLAKNLYLLYGPSVDQVFRKVLERDSAFSDQVADRLDREFERLLKV